MILEIVRDVRQVRSLWPHSLDGLQSLGNAKMCGVRFITQGVNHQRVQPLEQWPAFIRNQTDIRTEGNIGNSKSQNGQLPVKQPNWLNALAENFEWFESDPVKFQHRDRPMMQICGLLIECVRK